MAVIHQIMLTATNFWNSLEINCAPLFETMVSDRLWLANRCLKEQITTVDLTANTVVCVLSPMEELGPLAGQLKQCYKVYL